MKHNGMKTHKQNIPYIKVIISRIFIWINMLAINNITKTIDKDNIMYPKYNI